MYHIAVVEDEIECSEQIQKFLAQYQEENNVRFKVSAFADGMQILDGYEPVYDMILMDIDMPGMNGMDVSEQIRKTDQDVVLVFITNIASFAIRGYEVGALDYVVKPLQFYNFSMRLSRALKRSRAASDDTDAARWSRQTGSRADLLCRSTKSYAALLYDGRYVRCQRNDAERAADAGGVCVCQM